MTRGYFLRLAAWAALAAGFLAVSVAWSARTVPAAVEGMMADPPAAPPPARADLFPGLTRYVTRPLEWARLNFLFLAEVAFLVLAARGKIGGPLGVPDLVHAESRRVRVVNGLVIGMTAVNCLFVAYATGLDAVPWPVRPSPTLLPVDVDRGLPGEGEAVRRAGNFLLYTWVPVLLLACVGRPRGVPWVGVGLAASVAVALWLTLAGWHLLTGPWLGDWRQWYAYTPGAADGRIPRPDFVMHVIATGFTVLPFVLILLLTAAAAVGRPGSPVWVVCLCLWLFNAGYGFVSFHFGGLQFVLAGIAVALLVAANARHPYKLSLPGLGPEYAAARNGRPAPLAVEESPVGRTSVPLLRADEVIGGLAEWWGQGHGPGRKPKLLVVCTSGGGIRSSVWTAAVLAGLERRLGPAFRRHLRLITGASGGMLAAALYAGKQVHPLRPGLTDAGVLAEDSLWPTWQGLFFRDAPAALLPFHRDFDRAWSLEESWVRNAAPAQNGGRSPLAATFADLLAAERAGRAPSLVFSPLMVEDGRRLLVSNLCLADLSSESATTVGLGADGTPFADRVRVSQPAVELFRAFPDAHARFRVCTAARLSATFPYVSPAVYTPTAPPRRLVDAGFFDNYGVGLAAGWLLRNRDHLRAECGGVAVVEVRAFPLEAEKTGLADGRVGHPPDALGTVFAGLSTPAEALGVVRAAGAYYRNDHLLGLCDHAFNRGGRVPFFVRVPVECPGDGSLSWAISRQGRDEVVRCVAGCEKELSGLAAWFGDGGG